MSPTRKIRQLNDEFRHTLKGGQAFFTVGVSALGIAFSHRALAAVRAFDQFSPNNDPWHEHDFGSIEVDGQRVFWKIDVYDRDLRYGSPDPSDPEVSRRVLTVMLAEEY